MAIYFKKKKSIFWLLFSSIEKQAQRVIEIFHKGALMIIQPVLRNPAIYLIPDNKILDWSKLQTTFKSAFNSLPHNADFQRPWERSLFKTL